MRRHEMLRPSQRARMIADQLQQQAMQPRVGASGGGMVAPMHWGEGFAQLGQALLARRADKRADRLDKEERDSAAIANEEMIRALAPNERPQRLDEETGRPVGPGAAELLDVQTGRPMLSERGNLLARAIEGADPREAGDMLRSVTLQQAFAQPEAYTLGEGEARFVGGKKVAERPKSAEEKLTDDQREHAAAVERDGYTGTLQDWILEQRRASAPTINNKIGEPFREKLGKNLADELDKQYGEAQQAVAAIENIRHAKSLVRSGIISGTLADQRLGIAKALATFTGDDPAQIANTEEFISTTAKQVAENIKAFGSGTGLSDADREFAKQMAGGQITLNEQSIARILDINERAMTGKVNRYNDRRTRITKGFPDIAEFYEPISIPSADDGWQVVEIP